MDGLNLVLHVPVRMEPHAIRICIVTQGHWKDLAAAQGGHILRMPHALVTIHVQVEETWRALTAARMDPMRLPSRVPVRIIARMEGPFKGGGAIHPIIHVVAFQKIIRWKKFLCESFL